MIQLRMRRRMMNIGCECGCFVTIANRTFVLVLFSSCCFISPVVCCFLLRSASSSSSSSSRRGWFLGDECDLLEDRSNCFYHRPHTRGYLTNSSLEHSILSRVFSPAVLDVNPSECTVLLTTPLFNPPSLQREMDEMIFERYGFESYHRNIAASLALRGYQYEIQELYGKPNALIIDIGYSFTHIVPLNNYLPIASAIRRINIGGKWLTNYLAQLISFRQVQMRHDIHSANLMKEKCCYVSLDFERELERMRREKKGNGNRFMKEFVLPNGTTRMQGYVRGDTNSNQNTANTTHHADPSNRTAAASASSSSASSSSPPPPLTDADQVVSLVNERICVPEVLFSPSDIPGVSQMGLAEAVVDCVESCPVDFRPLLYEHIILVGGSSLFPNLPERLSYEVRSLIGCEFRLGVVRSGDPLTTTWCGGSCLSIDPTFANACVTKREYQEKGMERCTTKWDQMQMTCI